MKLSPFVLLLGLLFVLIGCNRAEERTTAPAAVAEATQLPTADSSELDSLTESDSSTGSAEPKVELDSGEERPAESASQVEQPIYGYTHHRADGNRLVGGKGNMPQMAHTDIALKGLPLWVVAAPWEDSSSSNDSTFWAVVLSDGQTQAFIVEGDRIEETKLNPVSSPENAPLLRIKNGQAELLTNPESADGQAPPSVLSDGKTFAYSSLNGQIFLGTETNRASMDVDIQALPDGRLLTDELDRLLFLSEPTTRYDHGVLGDRFEAGAVTLVNTAPSLEVAATISIPENQVVEGIAPLWADLTGDGRREIIVTQSGVTEGAGIVVYEENGDLLAQGPTIGLGYRWRHQLAVAPFGPNGELELVDVLTPHIGGVVEFYQLDGNELRIVAQLPGYTSHLNGSRNLDMALAGDLDGDGLVELLLPNQARTELGGIQRTEDGAAVDWTVDLDGRLSSNLAAVTLNNGELVVGAGREDGVLRIWHP